MRAAPAERTFGPLDHAALWASLGLSLYMMPFGSLLVPALRLEEAIGAVVVAALLSGLLLAAVAALAAHRGLGTVGLLSELFGRRASPLAAALLLLRNVAWAVFALALIADSAELVSDRALGAGLRPLWVVLFGLAGLALVLAGPQVTVRKVLRRGGVWVALLIAAGVTVSAYLEFGVPTYLERPSVGGWPSFWQAVDIMLVVPLLWLPVVADQARLGRDARGAFAGTFAGFGLAAAWMGILGAVYLPAVETGDIAGFVVGMKLGLGALVVLLLLQADEVYASVYSARVALEAASPAPAAQRASGAALGALVIALALPFDPLSSEGWFLLLASLFIPLFGVLAADQLFGRRAAAMAPSALGAWALGFLVYQWIAPSDVAWWRDALDWLFADALRLPFPLADEATWLGAAIPSFLAGFLLHALGRAALARARLAVLVPPEEATPAAPTAPSL